MEEWPTPGPEHAHAENARERGRPYRRSAFLLPGVQSRVQGEGDVGYAVTVPDFHHADPGRETENLEN